MNPTDNSLSQIGEVIEKGTAGIIILPANPTLDAQASAASLYLALSKAGKNISLVCSTVPESDIIAIDKVQQNLMTKGDNLVVSFPYTEGSIDKVDYNIQGNTFNLIISPRPGQPKLDAEKVQFSYSGGKIDFIITVDAPNLSALGAIYQENQEDFQNKQIINIDRHLVNAMYGTVNVVNKTASSTSELVLRVLTTLQYEIDKDIATNLYAGLTGATNYFTSYSVNAGTFETAAALLKLGAVKKPPMKQGAPAMPQTQTQPQPAPQMQNQQNRMPRPQQPQNQPRQQQAQPQAQPQNQKPIEAEEVKPQHQNPGEPAKGQAPQDWLKPKIFRSGGLL